MKCKGSALQDGEAEMDDHRKGGQLTQERLREDSKDKARWCLLSAKRQ